MADEVDIGALAKALEESGLSSAKFLQGSLQLGRKLGPRTERVLLDLYLRTEAWKREHPGIPESQWGDDGMKSNHRVDLVLPYVASLFRKIAGYEGRQLPPPLYEVKPKTTVPAAANPTEPTAIYKR